MKIKDLVNELEEKNSFREFKKNNPDAFFSAGFFVLNLEGGDETIQLDYFMSGEKKIAAFEFPFGEPKIYDEVISAPSQNMKQNGLGQTLEDGKTTGEIPDMKKQLTDLKIDIDDLASVSKETIIENESKLIPAKIIAVLRDDIWNLTCMDNALGIVQIKFDALSGEAINFNKGSLMDFMRIKKNHKS